MSEGLAAQPPRTAAAPNHYTNVACPFCGIVCDDLEIGKTEKGLEVIKNACVKAKAGFERTFDNPQPQVSGKTVSLDEAVKAAADLIRNSNLPMYGGLATDVEGMRAVMALADQSGGVVDHALSEAQYRNFKVLQTSGWVMTTLTETRNRADLIVIVASDLHKIHPRFFERVVNPEASVLSDDPPKRTIVFLGKGLDQSGLKGTRIGEVVTLDCELADVGEIIAALRVMVRGGALPAKTIAGLPRADVEALAERLLAASYGVFAWAPPSLNFPSADLTVQQVSELVKDLNVKGRAAGLALAGNEGAVTAAAVCAWQSGYPLRTSYASGKPDYDAVNYAIPRMLAAKDGDVLLWLASFTADIAVPETKIPTIVLGTPGLKMAQPATVFIPVGTPGADHAGRLVRVDNVVSLPLRNLHRSSLPRAADVLSAIQRAL